MDGNRKLTSEEKKIYDDYIKLKQQLKEKGFSDKKCYSILNNKYPQLAKFDSDFEIFQNNWANKSEKPSSKKSCMKVCKSDSKSYPTCMKECMSSAPSKLVEIEDGNETDGNETDDEMQNYEELKNFYLSKYSPYKAYEKLNEEGYSHLTRIDPTFRDFQTPPSKAETPPKEKTPSKENLLRHQPNSEGLVFPADIGWNSAVRLLRAEENPTAKPHRRTAKFQNRQPHKKTAVPTAAPDIGWDSVVRLLRAEENSREAKRGVDPSEGLVRRGIDRDRPTKRARRVERLLLVYIPPTDTAFSARQEACEKHMPYAHRPVSCTETVFRTLGFITHETFQKFVMENKPRPFDESISWAVKSTDDNTIQYQAKDLYTFSEIISSIPPNHSIMFMGERQSAIGHAMIIAKTQDNVLRFLDPSTGEIVDGIDVIQRHLTANGYIRFSLPYSYDTNADTNEKFSISNLKQWGGSKSFSINLNNLMKYKNLFAVLGNLIEKIFSKLSSQKNISISFQPFNYKNPVENSTLLLFGETNGKGNTMILAKGKEVILIDPISNQIYKGEKIKKHLNHFDTVLSININSNKYKTKTRKTKTRKTKKTKSVFNL